MENADFNLPEDIHTVVMGLGDVNGVMRGKRTPASHWPTICEDGVAFSMVLFAMDMTSDVWDTPYANFENGFPDFHMRPLTQPVPSPWEPGVAYCLGRAEGLDHQPVPIDPRGALLDQLARAEAMGFEILLGAELEFYLLDPETLRPRDSGIDVYGLDRAAEMEHVLGPIRRMINECGVPIEHSNPEYAAGQVEVNMRYGPALKVADDVILFRSLVKQLARHHGYLATFMAKPFIGEAGNGFHIHHSLWRDGRNVFAEDGALSPLGLNYLAGLQARMGEMAICAATTPNAYRRRRPYTFCPVNAAWGVDNRTAGLRVIEGADKAVRIEKRDGSADCNPYYLMAAEIAAGLDGIEQGLTPTHRTQESAYRLADAPPIPADIDTALRLARESDWLKSVIGEMRLEILIGQAEREARFVAEQVTPVERERYLGAL